MSVYLDVSTRLDRRAAEAAMAEARNMWRNTGDDIGKGLSGSINRALGAIDGSAARRTISELRNEHQLLARDAAEAHRLMERGLGDVETRTRRLSEVTAKYGSDSSQASAATVALADAHAIAARNTRDHEVAAANATAAHGRLDAATSKTATSIGAMGALANGVGVASLVGLGVTMAATTQKAADFEQGMIKLHAAAGETSENLKTVSDGILKVSTQTGTSAGELQNAMYLIEKAGYRGADGIKVLSAAAQGANAEQADLAEVVSGLTTSMVDFHIGPEKAAELMSKMVTAVGEAKTSFQDFAGALHSVEPAAAMAHLKLEDVWGTLAQITQSGTSPAQAAQNMNQAITSLARPNSVQAQKMQQLGISPDDISQNLSTRGLAGTLQTLYADIGKRVDPSTGKVDTGELTHNAGALQNLHDMLNMSGEGAMSDGAKQAAKSYMDGEMSTRQYTMAVRKANDEDAKKLQQFKQLDDQVNSFSKRLSGGRDTLETMNAALGDVTGTSEAASVAMQVTGENAQATNDKIKNIATTYTEADGSVKGFNESQEGLNAKMRDVKAGFSAVAIEMGSIFVPILAHVANGMKSVADFMSEHKGLAEGLVGVLTGVAGAWVAVRTAMMFRDGWDLLKNGVEFITSKAWPAIESMADKWGGVNTKVVAANAAMSDAGTAAWKGEAGVAAATAAEIKEENALADAALGADGALAGGAAGGGAARRTESEVSRDIRSGSRMIPGFIPLPEEMTKSRSSQDIQNMINDLPHHAGGGPVSGSGPKGKDSVRAWLAPGEHVLTASDVDAAGGHAGVYAWRNALHRELGGPSDIDAAILSNVPAGRYSQTGAADLTKGLADCSSAVEDLVNIIDGNSTSGRSMSTGNEAQWLTAHGFLPGMGGPGDFRVGFNSSHTQATLPGGTPFNWGSDAAAARGGVGGTGAYDPAFTQHFYRPVNGMGGEQRLFAAQDRVHKLEDRIAVLQQRISEETSKTKESEKIRLDRELQRAQDELAHAKDQLAEVERNPGGSRGYGRGGRGSGRGSSGGMQFGAPLPENFGLGKGIPGFFEWLTTFAADMAIGPIEGAMLGNYLRSGGDMSDLGGAAGGFGDIAAAAGVPLTGLDPSLGGNYAPPAAGGGGGGSGSGGGASSSGGAGGSGGGSRGLWWKPGSKPASAPITDMADTAPAGPGGPGRFIGPVSQADLAQGALLGGMLGTAPGYGWRNPGNPVLDLLNPSRDPSGIGGAPFGALASPGGGINLGGLAASASASKNMYQQFYGYGKQFSTGGPSGTDTIPAWLSPGEFVMNSQATKNNLMALQLMNAGHYDTGTQQPLQPGAGQGQPAPKPGGAQQPKPMPQQGKPHPEQQGQQHLTGALNPGPGNEKILGSSDVHPGVATPGADTQQFGEGLPASSGIGFGGGLIGGLEQAAAGAASAAGAAGGGGGGAAAGMALNAAFQMMNRTAGYVGQLGGIAAEGILSTLLPADSPLSNFSNTLPGKLIAGIAGVRTGQPNSAGKTEAPLKTKGLEDQSRDGGGTQGGGAYAGGDSIGSQTNFHGPITVKANNPQEFQQQMTREFSGARAAYPTNLP